MPPVSVLLNAIEEAQGELINYIDPNNPKRSAAATIDKLTHIFEDPVAEKRMVLVIGNDHYPNLAAHRICRARRG